MNKTPQGLRSGLLTIAAMFGRFGDVGAPVENHKEAIIRGLHKFHAERVSHKKRSKPSMRARSGHGKGHRRTWLTGNPTFNGI